MLTVFTGFPRLSYGAVFGESLERSPAFATHRRHRRHGIRRSSIARADLHVPTEAIAIDPALFPVAQRVEILLSVLAIGARQLLAGEGIGLFGAHRLELRLDLLLHLAFHVGAVDEVDH
jgi:hypothetical protein